MNMSDEERAVLDFFAKEENLPLALSVAELVDGIRQRMNNAFWQALRVRLVALLEEHKLPWVVEVTEDRNTAETVVGLHLQPQSGQSLFLRLMMEQQYMGETLRIYYGVMWSEPPGAGKMRLDSVMALGEALQREGFKSNENFLAWNWTPYHPRRRDFLQRYAMAGENLLDEVSSLLRHLLLEHGKGLQAANEALQDTPQAVTVSLDQLRASLRKVPEKQQ
jgi:hypothetical protein